MCMGTGVPPYGIPITDDIHQMYPPEIQKAWRTFHNWWKNNFDGVNPVSRSKMSAKVAEALEAITNAPIPGYCDKTGKDSCYVIGINARLCD